MSESERGTFIIAQDECIKISDKFLRFEATVCQHGNLCRKSRPIYVLFGPVEFRRGVDRNV